MTKKDLRVVELSTEDDVRALVRMLNEWLDEDVDDSEIENWLDSEFHRIYVTYAYPDVTKVN